MRTFSNVSDAARYFSTTGKDCIAVYPYDARALYLNTTKRQHVAILYKNGQDTRFVIDRVGA